MKKILLLIPLISCLSAFAQQSPSEGEAILQFKTAKIDLGKISKDEPKTIRFEYSNTGTKPLLITKVDVSCGCVKPIGPSNPYCRIDKTQSRFNSIRTQNTVTLY